MCSAVDYSRQSVLSWMMPSNLFFPSLMPDNLFLLDDARWSVLFLDYARQSFLFWIMPDNQFCFWILPKSSVWMMPDSHFWFGCAPDNLFCLGWWQDICSVFYCIRQSVLFWVMSCILFCFWLCHKIWVFFTKLAIPFFFGWFQTISSVSDEARHSVLFWTILDNHFCFGWSQTISIVLDYARISVMFWIIPDMLFSFGWCQTIWSVLYDARQGLGFSFCNVSIKFRWFYQDFNIDFEHFLSHADCFNRTTSQTRLVFFAKLLEIIVR